MTLPLAHLPGRSMKKARLVRKYPGRFGFFASTPLPDVQGAIVEVRYAIEQLGADGVVFETNFHGVYLGDERLAPLYAELESLAAVIFIHPTSPYWRADVPAQRATLEIGSPQIIR
jgi:6-methylsalicylate decarboxylase